MNLPLCDVQRNEKHKMSNHPNHLDFRSTAIIVVDVQNDFCHTNGRSARDGDVYHLDAVVDNTIRFVSEARLYDVPIAFTQTTHSHHTDTPEWLARYGTRNVLQWCREGSWGAEFYKIKPEPEDLVVTKHRYSSFAQTNLNNLLSGLGRKSLLFCGVATNICVESSLRDAVDLDFLATLVRDCCGGSDVEGHLRSIRSVEQGFGIVSDSSSILHQWSLQR